MGLLCFSFLLTFVFFCQGRIRFENWAWPTWLLFCSDPVPFVSCCKFGCLFVCLYVFFFHSRRITFIYMGEYRSEHMHGICCD